MGSVSRVGQDATPIFVERIRPQHTGKRLLALEAVGLHGASSWNLRIIKRAADHLVADFGTEDTDTVIIRQIAAHWLRQHCPELLDEHPLRPSEDDLLFYLDYTIPGAGRRLPADQQPARGEPIRFTCTWDGQLIRARSSFPLLSAAAASFAELKPVAKKIHTNRPSYSFKTSKSGRLNFNGKCRGNVDKAVVGINHIALLTAEPGDYDDCTMTLTDSSNNRSQPLKISPFVVVGGQS